jgi:hypothetical protein
MTHGNPSRRTAILGACLLPLALDGCAALATDLSAANAAIGKVAATVTTDLSSATAIYNSIKGVAQVVLAVTAPIDPIYGDITAAIAVADAAVAAAPAAITTVATLLSSAASLGAALVGKWQASALSTT